MNTWHTGYNNWIKNTLIVDSSQHSYNLELLDIDCDESLDINSALIESIQNRPSLGVELLFSGGVDSESILLFLLNNSIPVTAITLVYKLKNIPINIYDLYYAEKFCREHSVKHKIIELDLDTFFDSGKFLDYIQPYYIREPHVAALLWLMEQCERYPIFAGSWPWLQTHKSPYVISPLRIDFNNIYKFMIDKSITGIGNMLSHSLLGSAILLRTHKQLIENGNYNTTKWEVSRFKRDMYKTCGWHIRDYRIEHWGLENFMRHNPEFYAYDELREHCYKLIGTVQHTIKWNKIIARAIDIDPGMNDSFT